MLKIRVAGGMTVMMALVVLQAWGGVIFEDDFSNPTNSLLNWVSSNASVVTMSFEDGVCKANNTDNVGGLIYHTFNNGKPSTFTLSGKITRSSENLEPGFFFCLGITGTVTGYYARIGTDSYITVFRTDSENPLLSVKSPFVASATNELKICKQGSSFVVFCNGRKVGSFTDSKYSSGDIAMFLPKNTAAVFDDIKVTDTFDTLSSVNACFSDDFNSNAEMFGWATLSDEAEVKVADGKLHLTTGKYAYVFTDISLEEFTMRVDVSFVSGSKNSMYGLFIKGDGSPIPMSGFIITGNRSFGVFANNQSIPLTPNTAIRGAVVAGLIDTLEVRKSKDTGYIFRVNGVNLDTLDNIGFVMTGVGVFCNDSLDLTYDNFAIAEGDSPYCPGTDIAWNPSYSKVRFAPATRNNIVFDPLGRIISGSRTNVTDKKLPAGIYLKHGQKAIRFKP